MSQTWLRVEDISFIISLFVCHFKQNIKYYHTVTLFKKIIVTMRWKRFISQMWLERFWNTLVLEKCFRILERPLQNSNHRENKFYVSWDRRKYESHIQLFVFESLKYKPFDLLTFKSWLDENNYRRMIYLLLKLTKIFIPNMACIIWNVFSYIQFNIIDQ